MATYICLLRFTEQGAKNFQDSPKRAASFKETAKRAGAKIIGQYWTTGKYDGVLIFETADDAAATSLMLSLASLGNVRTNTMRAFGATEFSNVLAKVPKA